MPKKILVLCIFSFLLIGSVTLVAVQPNRGADRPNALLKETVPFSGAIQEIELAAALGQPSIVVGGKAIRLAPYYILEQSDLLIEMGVEVEGECFESLSRPGTFLAVWISNIGDENHLDLRDEFGRPLWTMTRGFGRGRGFGPRMGGGRCGACSQDVDPESIVTLSGAVSNLNLGRGFPSFALGESTVMAGPYRAWLDTNFTLEEGDEVEVTAFPSWQFENTLVAVRIVKGEEILELRGANGLPIQGRGVCWNARGDSYQQGFGPRQGRTAAPGSGNTP